jgi:hypothetical protein
MWFKVAVPDVLGLDSGFGDARDKMSYCRWPPIDA